MYACVLLVHGPVTDDDGAVVGGRGEQRVAGVVGHASHRLLMVPGKRITAVSYHSDHTTQPSERRRGAGLTGASCRVWLRGQGRTRPGGSHSSHRSHCPLEHSHWSDWEHWSDWDALGGLGGDREGTGMGLGGLGRLKTGRSWRGLGGLGGEWEETGRGLGGTGRTSRGLGGDWDETGRGPGGDREETGRKRRVLG